MNILPTARKILIILAALLTGIVAGQFYIFSYGVNGGFEQLSGPEYTQAMRVINFSVRGDPYFGAAFFGSLAIPLLGLLLFWGHYITRGFTLFIIAYLLYALGTFLVTVQIHLPLNFYLESWDVAAPAADWQETRDAWNQANLIRTWAAVLSSAFYLILLGFFMPTTTSTAPHFAATHKVDPPHRPAP